MKGLKATATPSLAFSLGVSENHPPLGKKKKENHSQYKYFPYCNCSSKTCQILCNSHSGNVSLAFCMCLQNNPCSALRSPMASPYGSSWPQMGVFLPKPLHSLFQYLNVCWKLLVWGLLCGVPSGSLLLRYLSLQSYDTCIGETFPLRAVTLTLSKLLCLSPVLG